jgi:tight adherence protein C
MALLLIIGLFLIGAAGALLVRAAFLPRIRADRSVGRIAAYGYAGEVAAEAPDGDSLATRVIIAVGSIAERTGSSERREEVRKLLLAAGFWNTKAETVLGYRVLATMVLGTVMLWSTAGNWSPFLAVVATVYAAGIGWFGPIFLLKRRASSRTTRIELQLPELIDLLVVTLEAGVGFTAALHRSTEQMTGPLGEEIRLTLREHSLGLSMDRALANLLERADVPAVRSFVRAVIQSEALGVSIGQVMRDLATEMRTRRRQIIEEKAQKAPIKMLFPLAFLILPSLLLIVLYPGVVNMLETLANTG